MQGKLFYCWRGAGGESELRLENAAQLGDEPYDVANRHLP